MSLDLVDSDLTWLFDDTRGENDYEFDLSEHIHQTTSALDGRIR